MAGEFTVTTIKEPDEKIATKIRCPICKKPIYSTLCKHNKVEWPT